MKTRRHRTQILREREQHQALTRIAHLEGRSISEIIRSLVQSELDRREHDAEARKQQRLAALARIRKHREKILAERGGRPIE